MTRDHPRRDRTGEPIDEPEPHDPRCHDGWINRDSTPARPCYHCKPWTRPDRRRAQIHGPHGG
ncbi:hypothetical protein FHX69_4140 [Prauserella muralis]|nr:hypothetical protein FHX69_4140 [Prauserella muralis]